jgi:hypothetical protein
MTANDWGTVANLATALGTLVLAIATFSAIRSANRAARTAERALFASLRPLLMPTKQNDPEFKVNYGDSKWVHLPGGQAAAEIGGGDGTMGSASDVVYLAIALRNVGTGMGVIHGWTFYPRWQREEHPAAEGFRTQGRDLYVPAGDTGFWQAAFRDQKDPQYAEARKVVEAREPWTVELLYGDYEGGQRVVTRFTAIPAESGKGWLASVGRHWNIDRPDPRQR